LLQNLCLFRVVEAFNGSTVMDIMQSIVSAVGIPAKLVMPRKIQDNKKVLYRVSTNPYTFCGFHNAVEWVHNHILMPAAACLLHTQRTEGSCGSRHNTTGGVVGAQQQLVSPTQPP
jgi:hypothetical protein